MDIYQTNDIQEILRGNPYVGRGIVVGKSEDGRYAVAAYFIMGRSENSRNRIFAMRDGVLYTEPYDARKVADPSLIMYPAVREIQNGLIVTNGDQTDTIYAKTEEGKSFSEAMQTRTFEPDAPNWTPRISALLSFANGSFSYQMSIVKSGDGAGSGCNRFTFAYEPLDGLGHFLHTYVTDGNPLPTFVGEPERVRIPNDIDEFCRKIWDGLNEENKISLFVRYTDGKTGEKTDRIRNKNE